MSGGNGDGKGFFDNVVNVESFSGKGNFFENLGSDFLNAGLQGVTGGVIGFENGGISNGVTTNLAKKSGKELVSGTKEVTGAKAAEEANKVARQQFEQAAEDAKNARIEAQAATAKDQVRQSQMAGAARASATTRSANKGTAIGGSVLGADEKDFLGL